MPSYRVTWEIDLDADSAREAAQEARTIQLDPASIATCFTVREDGAKDSVEIDLADQA